MEEIVSRKKNSIKGIVSALLSNVLKIVTQFIFRSVFIYYLSVEFLGLNSAIAGILNFLSLTELGITSAITFNLYKPVAEDDKEKINSILNLFKRFYCFVGIAILLIGSCLLPFLKYLIKDANTINANVYIAYMLYLLSTVITYFWSYRSVLFTVYQHQYKVNIFNTILTCTTSIIQIITIIIFRGYYAFLFAQLACSFLANIVTYLYTKKLYPEIDVRNSKKLDNDTKKDIYSNIKGMFYHKLSYAVLQGTDSVVISSFIGALLLGVYSNYTIFVTNITSIIVLVNASFAGSVGNLIAEGNSEKSYSIYKTLKFCFFWLSGFCAIALFVLLNPTIEIWAHLGKWAENTNWTLNLLTVFVIVLNFYLYTTRCITCTFRDAIGNFHKDRFKGLVEALINVIVSLILVKPLGIAGVLIGTIASCLCTSFWVDPYMVYKYHFKKPLWYHFKDFLFYTTIVLIAGVITHFICGFISDGTIGFLIAKLSICLVVPNIIMLFCFMPTKEFKSIIEIIKGMLKNKYKKQKDLV